MTPANSLRGHVTDIRQNSSVRFRFLPNGLSPLTVEDIWDNRDHLGLEQWDFRRTRWRLQSADLYQVLAERSLLARPLQPTAFTLPQVRPEPDRIAVMMPFDSSFDPVWATLQEVAADGGWVCERADSIWENAKVLDDVVLLIARASVVICDLTGRNAKVFYETGLAHMLGRPTVLLAQSKEDIPFDLQAERYLRYLTNTEGIAVLKVALAERLKTLRRASRRK